MYLMVLTVLFRGGIFRNAKPQLMTLFYLYLERAGDKKISQLGCWNLSAVTLFVHWRRPPILAVLWMFKSFSWENKYCGSSFLLPQAAVSCPIFFSCDLSPFCLPIPKELYKCLSKNLWCWNVKVAQCIAAQKCLFFLKRTAHWFSFLSIYGVSVDRCLPNCSYLQWISSSSQKSP